jgi:hypothetical protein
MRSGAQPATATATNKAAASKQRIRLACAISQGVCPAMNALAGLEARYPSAAGDASANPALAIDGA